MAVGDTKTIVHDGHNVTIRVADNGLQLELGEWRALVKSEMYVEQAAHVMHVTDPERPGDVSNYDYLSDASAVLSMRRALDLFVAKATAKQRVADGNEGLRHWFDRVVDSDNASQ